MWASANGQGVETGLRRAVGHLGGGRLDRRRAADVDDAPAVVGLHVFGSEGGEPERPFQVDADHLVEQLLGHRPERAVQR